MNQFGIAVDLSHSGQQTTADGIAASTKPVLITHTGCTAVFRHPCNKDDRELRAMAERGGVLGVYLMPYLCDSPKIPTAGDVLAHLVHALRVCGEDHVGIGTDNSVQAVELSEDQRKTFSRRHGLLASAPASPRPEKTACPTFPI